MFILFQIENDSNIRKAFKISNKIRQKKLTQLLATFIIQSCQPFRIIESPSFIELVRGLEPGFVIPCVKTMHKVIRDAFDWSTEQLLGMMASDADTINITTDLWTSRRNDVISELLQIGLIKTLLFAKLSFPVSHYHLHIQLKIFEMLFFHCLS